MRGSKWVYGVFLYALGQMQNIIASDTTFESTAHQMQKKKKKEKNVWEKINSKRSGKGLKAPAKQYKPLFFQH